MGMKIGISILILLALATIASVIAAMILLFQGRSMATGNVAVITMEGVILAGTGSARGGIVGSDTILEDIRTAEETKSIKAVIFRVNSPGGSAVASDEVVTAIQGMEKPSVAIIRETGASGAYWIASAADHVIANRMSVTGSIGIIGSYLSFGRFLEHWNVTYNQLVSGEMKDVGTPFREIEPNEREFLAEKLALIHAFFVESVAENRNLSVEEVEPLADGRFFLGSEALSHGLVDALGGEREAVAWLKETHGIEAELVEYTHTPTLMQLLSELGAARSLTPEAALAQYAEQGRAVPMAR